jgi:hypothetical protein
MREIKVTVTELTPNYFFQERKNAAAVKNFLGSPVQRLEAG